MVPVKFDLIFHYINSQPNTYIPGSKIEPIGPDPILKCKLAKDGFNNGLQDCLIRRNRRVMFILIGDLNAKLGKNNQGFEEVMGQ